MIRSGMPTAPPFRSVLVANRGEIAVRVIRTLRRLGIRSVAVHTEADGGSAPARHVREADLALAVPSYLDVDAVVAAAQRAAAEAIHPGYGFLSESPALARACAEAGLVWVGPDEAALELMGDKIASKAHVERLGVPVIPGVAEDHDAPPAATDPSATARLLPVSPGTPAGTARSGDGSDRDRALAAQAEAIGFPLLIKPSAGGGGKGMTVVRSAVEMAPALAAARRVAAAAFGDDTLLLEKLVPRSRHIEAQVLGDSHGQVEFLGLRECSLQRRHQKVIEEAPAPYPPGSTRELIAAAAVRIAHSVGYVGAGTVEFLVAGDDPTQWFFLEMNTRLQVEHPVTEAVTGLDLVEAQLRVAAGEPLGIQRDVAEHGHAAEARVYAERPEQGFVPSAGTLLVVEEPDGVRVDSGVVPGQRVGTDYDPMLLKVVAYGRTRADALGRLDAALARTVVLGVHTNIGYLRSVLAAPDVRDGVADTAFLDAFEPPSPGAPDADVLAAAAHALAPSFDGDPSPWASRSGWRLGEHRVPTVTLAHEGAEVIVPIPAAAPPGLRTAVDGDVAWVWRDGVTWRLQRRTRAGLVEASRRARAGATPDPQLRTPMPGTVISVADPGEVAAGAVVAVVEAMKMEHPVTAPVAGILEIAVRQGETVTADQLLATIHVNTHGGSARTGGSAPRVPPENNPAAADAAGRGNPKDPQDQG